MGHRKEAKARRRRGEKAEAAMFVRKEKLWIDPNSAEQGVTPPSMNYEGLHSCRTEGSNGGGKRRAGGARESASSAG